METDLNLVIRGELTTTCEQRSGVKPLYSLRNTLAVGLQYGLGRGGGHGACSRGSSVGTVVALGSSGERDRGLCG